MSPNGANAYPITLHAAIYVLYNYRKSRCFSQLKKAFLDSKIGYMDKNTILIIIACLAVAAIIVIIIMVKSAKKNNLKKVIDGLYVRFNKIKTVPIAFKLNKAQAMAKRSEETAISVEEYYHKYEQTEKNINLIQEMLNNIDDYFIAHKYKETKETIKLTEEELSKCEQEIKGIDDFLEEFSKKEDEQREYSANLKEKYRIVKQTINDNANVLSIAFNGLSEKLEKCEDLFSSSEEWMYASDYISAQNDLSQIDALLDEIKINANAVPKCIKDAKGVLPVMIDEAKREYALTKQRGVFVAHLDIDNKLAKIDSQLNEDLKKLMNGSTEGIRDNCREAKMILNELIESLAAENRSYKEAKETNDKAFEHTNDLEKVESYVRIAYDKDSARFGLDNLRPILKTLRDNIDSYRARYQEIAEELASTMRPSSEILVDAENLCADIEIDKKELYQYKTVIDKSTDGETRAASQLTKLQLVVSEVETKIAEYHLPTISPSYVADLDRSREYIGQLRVLINQVPINIDSLNTVLDEAIDFIYKFYNNVNNVVGMAIMVENAIVFGNKYRSTFPEIDRELSKAEFQYLNGEYTKALKTAIACMETLFPDNVDEKIMENA